MRILGLLIICTLSSMGLIEEAIPCHMVLQSCNGQTEPIPSCIERKMRNCTRKSLRLLNPDLYLNTVNSKETARVDISGHVINIPPEALMRSTRMQTNSSVSDVNVTIYVLDNNLFKAPPVHGSVQDRVIGVWLGEKDVHNLSHPVEIVFRKSCQIGLHQCVFWKQAQPSDQGLWSTEGCSTECENMKYSVCKCNHLSFFAMLISPGSLPEDDARRLQSITYIGSSLSVLFTGITILLFGFHSRKRKSEHSVIIHAQLAGSLFLLHMFFLISTFLTVEEGTVCKVLGILLHWALLATFTWTAVEGFHLYLLLVRVFNIYIRRYLLKLCLVSWGIPIITVIISGVIGEYGIYTLETSTGNGTHLCWIKTKAIRYVTVNSYLGLVLLFNAVILVMMVGKMWQLRVSGVPRGYNMRRLWKDWFTIMGLCWVLGIPWGLAFTTYGPLNLPGLYLFTILNSFQGVFMFLWFLSVTCKTIQEDRSSSKTSKLSMSNPSS